MSGIIFRTRHYVCVTVPLRRCWLTTSPSHYKGPCSFAFGTTSWGLSLRMEIIKLKGVCWDVTTNRTRLQTRMKLVLVPLNNANVHAKKINSGPAARDQNNKNLCEVTPASREQNNENVRDASGAQDQNDKTTREAKTHSGGKTQNK